MYIDRRLKLLPLALIGSSCGSRLAVGVAVPGLAVPVAVAVPWLRPPGGVSQLCGIPRPRVVSG